MTTPNPNPLSQLAGHKPSITKFKFFRIKDAQREIDRLEALVAAKDKAASPATAPAASTLPKSVLDAAAYLRLNPAERLQFCQDGGKILRAEFQQLTPATFSLFLKNGGKLTN